MIATSISTTEIVGSLAITLAVLFATTHSSHAQNFGAIAFSQSNGAHGYAWDYPTRAEAERRAINECRAHGGYCQVAVWFRDACGALAVGSRRGWGASWGTTRYEAEASAMGICNANDYGCSVIRWVCTTR